METTEQDKILNEVAEIAYINRAVLVQKFKKQKTGNVKIILPHKFDYVYGETIKNPQIVFPDGQTISDMDFFSKTIWKR